MRPDQDLLDKVVAPGLISGKHRREPLHRGKVARRELVKCHRTSAWVAHASHTRPERPDPLCERADPLDSQRHDRSSASFGRHDDPAGGCESYGRDDPIEPGEP
jgi:hypothetical protein